LSFRSIATTSFTTIGAIRNAQCSVRWLPSGGHYWIPRSFKIAFAHALISSIYILALSVRTSMTVISALEDGFETYVVGDACGDVSTMAHEMAMTRMIQAGAVPMNWLQVLLELQRDWARKETYDAVLEVVKEHGGTYGLGVEYAKAVMGAHGGTAMP
jgi:nicotinamidase-related amidase